MKYQTMVNNGLEIDPKKFLKFCLSSKKKLWPFLMWHDYDENDDYVMDVYDVCFELAIIRYRAIHQPVQNVKWNRKESTSLNVKWV